MQNFYDLCVRGAIKHFQIQPFLQSTVILVFETSFSQIKSATKAPASKAQYKLWISVCLRADSHFPSRPQTLAWHSDMSIIIFFSWRFCKWPFFENIKVNLLRSDVTVHITLVLINVLTKHLYQEFLWVSLVLYSLAVEG